VGGAITVLCQQPKTQPARARDEQRPKCQCGAHPPGPERAWTADPYAGEPEDMRPYAKFITPYSFNYLQPTIWNGPGRDTPDPKGLKEVRIGFVAPVDPTDPDYVFGRRMLRGAQMAVDEADAHGGYNGIPYKLVLRGDYNNWQANAAAGSYRPTDPEIWGAAGDAAVKLIYDDKVWAIFGSISSESTHIMLRLVLKAEISLVNSASTDPTIPETSVPWYFTDLQDDRVQCYTLARRIYTDLGLKRVAILRVNNRYGRMGVPKFRAASRRLGHPVVIEQKFFAGDTDFSRQLRIIQESRTDAIVLWTDEAPAAMILKQMRAMGMKQRVFGSYRTLGPELLAEAGPAAEGFEAVFPYDPTRNDPRWIDFNQRFEARFHEKPDQFASLAYDAMNILLDSICKAGLNRVRIQDALDNVREYDGVTAHMIFDPNQKNVSPMYIGTVHNGEITYRLEPMSERPAAQHASANASGALAPYARVGEDGVGLAPPSFLAAPAEPVRVVVFGPQAAEVANSRQMQSVLRHSAQSGKQWTLLPIESKQNWGAASTQLVHALMDEHAVAIMALDRDASHLSEQLALKCFVPVVALSDDKSLTSADIPWIFRLRTGTEPAVALRLLEQAAARGGANPSRMRDVLASGATVAGIAFQPTGEVRLP
jgi:ABC-type branched-subunit amino acid transport system substrate-binding protein